MPFDTAFGTAFYPMFDPPCGPACHGVIRGERLEVVLLAAEEHGRADLLDGDARVVREHDRVG